MRKINALIFTVGLLSFLLPFMEVSCGHNALMVVTGKQLVTGFSISAPRDKISPPTREEGGPMERKFKGDKYARAVAALLVVALLVGLFLKYPLASYILAVISVAGGAALLLLRSKILQRAAERGAGFIAVRFREGYWILLGVFALGFLLNLLPRRKG